MQVMNDMGDAVVDAIARAALPGTAQEAAESTGAGLLFTPRTMEQFTPRTKVAFNVMELASAAQQKVMKDHGVEDQFAFGLACQQYIADEDFLYAMQTFESRIQSAMEEVSAAETQ